MNGTEHRTNRASALPLPPMGDRAQDPGRIIGALLRVDGPRTISEMARLADVSRDRAATVVTRLERLGLIERRPAGRAHLVALIEESPVTESLREIERSHERSVERLRRAARSIKPAPEFMALYGSWARGEATEASDLDVAVIAEGAGDREALLEALDEWSGLAKRVTGASPVRRDRRRLDSDPRCPVGLNSTRLDRADRRRRSGS
jgi:predicted nucleotidyltransferase